MKRQKSHAWQLLSAATIGLAAVLWLSFATTEKAAIAGNEPELTGLSFSPSTIAAGQTVTLSFTAPNATSVENVFFKQPDGTNGFLSVSEFEKTNATFSATVFVPANAAGGVWRVSELGVRNSEHTTFRFLAGDIHPSSPCPSFENTGLWTCSSDVVREQGKLNVEQSAITPMIPSLTQLSFSQSTIAAGESVTLSFTAPGANAVESVFFRQPDGTNGSLSLNEFAKSNETFSATVIVPANAAGGVWRVSELGVRNSEDVTFRFSAGDIHPGSPCPVFQNIGVWSCSSDLVREQGRLTVLQSAPAPAAPSLTGLSFSPSSVLAGHSVTLSLTASNAVSVENVFFKRPDGTSGFLPVGQFDKTNDIFSATVIVPANAAEGVWRVSELGVRNSEDVTFRFSASDIHPGSPCPIFQNTVVWSCSSDIVREQGRLTVLVTAPPDTVTPSPMTPTPTQLPNPSTSPPAAASPGPTSTPSGDDLPIPVETGSNLVSWPSGTVAIEVAVQSFSRPVRFIYEYDAASGSWRRYAPGLPSYLSNLATVRSGAAYWVIVD